MSSAMNLQQKELLIASVIKFLETDLKAQGDSPDFTESVEVAVQCLASSYSISPETVQAAPQLDQIFLEGAKTLGIATTKKEVTAADREEAEKKKARGNECMTENKYLEAVDCYTKALELDPFNAVYFGNRAAAYSKLNEHDSAIKDCEKALAMDRTYIKAYGRMGFAYASLGDHTKAVEMYEAALNADPNNDSYKQNLETAQQRLQESSAGSGGPRIPGGPGGLDLMSMLNNPAMMNMATQMMSSPQMQQMMSQFVSGMQPPASGGGQEAPSDAAQPNMQELLQMGQHFASQMQSQNPDLVANLRQQFQQNQQSPDDSTSGQGPPDYIS